MKVAFCFTIPFVYLLALRGQNVNEVPKTNNKNKYSISCSLNGLPNNAKAFLLNELKDTILTRTINNGKFSFAGTLNSGGRLMYIVFEPHVSYYPSEAIFVTPTEMKIIGTVRRDNMDLLITGSSANNDLKNFNNHIKTAFAKYTQLENKLSSSNITEQEIAETKLDKIDAKANLILEAEKWIKNNFRSEVIPLVINQLARILPNSSLNNLFSNLNSNQKNSFYGKELYTFLENYKIFNKFKNGYTMPNLSLIDSSGNKTDVYHLIKQHKYTLIDFWASWCGPCRSANPELRKNYHQFKENGFNIIGISIDESTANWIKAVNEDENPWKQFIISDASKITKEFGINRIPAYILLDQDSRMIALTCISKDCLVQSFGSSLKVNSLNETLRKITRSDD